MDSSNLSLLRSTCLYQPGHKKTIPRTAGHWSVPVQDLLESGYSFLPIQYSDGYLFRGIRAGLGNAIEKNRFEHIPVEDEISRVERAMSVYFLTHEISDAISVSAIHNPGIEDNGILVFNSFYFNSKLQQKKAAVLAIGDAGMVFRYPLFTEPLTMDDIDYVITISGKKGTPALDKLHIPDNKQLIIPAGNRQQLGKAITEKFRQLGMTAARPVSSNLYPH